MRPRTLRLMAGLAPFVLLVATLGLFVQTRDPMSFAYGGALAALYVIAFLLMARRRARRRLAHRRRGRK